MPGYNRSTRHFVSGNEYHRTRYVAAGLGASVKEKAGFLVTIYCLSSSTGRDVSKTRMSMSYQSIRTELSIAQDNHHIWNS